MEDPTNQQQPQKEQQETRKEQNCSSNDSSLETSFEMNADEEDDEEQSFDLVQRKSQNATETTTTTANNNNNNTCSSSNSSSSPSTSGIGTTRTESFDETKSSKLNALLELKTTTTTANELNDDDTNPHDSNGGHTSDSNSRQHNNNNNINNKNRTNSTTQQEQDTEDELLKSDEEEEAQGGTTSPTLRSYDEDELLRSDEDDVHAVPSGNNATKRLEEQPPEELNNEDTKIDEKPEEESVETCTPQVENQETLTTDGHDLSISTWDSDDEKSTQQTLHNTTTTTTTTTFSSDFESEQSLNHIDNGLKVASPKSPPSAQRPCKQFNNSRRSSIVVDTNTDVNGNGNDIELEKQQVEDFLALKQRLNGKSSVEDRADEPSPIKVNGDYKAVYETEEDENEVVDDVQGESNTNTTTTTNTKPNDIEIHNEAVIVKPVDGDDVDDEDVVADAPTKKPNGPPLLDWHDNNSRCSSPADSESSKSSEHSMSSSSSSSTQQLVIDDVLEGGVGGGGAVNSGERPTMKQSRSNSNDTETEAALPKRQRPHVVDVIPGDIVERVARDENKLNKIVEQTERMEVVVAEDCQLDGDAAPLDSFASPRKSFLMQLLERERSPRASPQQQWMSPLPPLGSAAPNLFCYNCKSNTFTSVAELSAHLNACIPETSPSRPQTYRKPHAVRPQSPFDKSMSSPTTTSPYIMKTNAHSESATSSPVTPKKRIFGCSACDENFDENNIYFHMLNVHSLFTCTSCGLIFMDIDKLGQHLEFDHDKDQQHHPGEDSFRATLPRWPNSEPLEERFLVCCKCTKVMREHEMFTEHNCIDCRRSCPQCGQKGRHTTECRKQTKAARRLKKSYRRDRFYVDAQLNGMAMSPFQPPAQQQQQHAAVSAQPTPPPVHCDNSIETAAALASPAPSPTMHTFSSALFPSAAAVPNEDSNSSCNMVIDESCSTQHHVIPAVNPFKMLDERERQEQEQINNAVLQPVLPPDRLAPDGGDSVGGWFAEQQPYMAPPSQTPPTSVDPIEEPAEPSPVVPKLRLRVPKEYQKPVDDAISSSDSEYDAEEEGVDDDDATKADTSATTEATEASTSDQQNADGPTNDTTLEQSVEPQQSTSNVGSGDEAEPASEESQDGSTTNLERIMQEIEKTKMDIQRTRDREHIPTVQAEPEAQQQQQQQQQGEQEQKIEDEKEELPPASLLVESRTEEFENLSQPSAAPEQPQPPADDETSLALDNVNTSDEPPRTLAADEKEAVEVLDVLKHSGPLDEGPLEKLDAAVSDDEAVIDVERPPPPPSDGIELASEDITVLVELRLDKPLDKFEPVDFVRLCVKSVSSMCLFCRHARRIAVNGRYLLLHLLSHHRFAATVDSITAEELQPDTIIAKLKSYLPVLEAEYFNSSNYCSMGDGAFKNEFNERLFECFVCRYETPKHKELYTHNRKMHLRQPIKCFMCHMNFHNFSDLLCHLCPGSPNPQEVVDPLYRCCLCDVTNLPSTFRLMVHLRKSHHTCDVCLEDCLDQNRLAQHVWKHKQQHRCFRCNIAYRNKEDINRHMFWKHGTESVLCKRCLGKRWRHMYHFCAPKPSFACEICKDSFPKAVQLRVHRRIHQDDCRHACEDCEAKFISRGLLAKHKVIHEIPKQEEPPDNTEGVVEATEGGAEGGAVGGESVDAVDAERGVKVENDAEEPPAESKPSLEGKDEMEKTAEPVKQIKTERKLSETLTDTKPEYQQRMSKSQPASRRCSVTEPKGGSDISPVKKKKKKGKSSKEFVGDLNLIAPNLSESDSSDSDDGSGAAGDRTKSEGDDTIVPSVMLSPPSGADSDNGGDGEEPTKREPTPDKAMEIWQNFFKTQGETDVEKRLGQAIEEANYTEDNYPQPKQLHVCISDHDYSEMRPAPPPPPKSRPAPVPVLHEPTPEKEVEVAVPTERRRRRNSNASSCSSSSSSSSSSGDSSGSSSSSSSDGSSDSSDDSDSSAASNVSTPRKRIRKKSERDQKRKKSMSVSPSKKPKRADHEKPTHGGDAEDEKPTAAEDSVKKEEDVVVSEPVNAEPEAPPFHPSDYETDESETDEEFYDAQPYIFSNAGNAAAKIYAPPPLGDSFSVTTSDTTSAMHTPYSEEPTPNSGEATAPHYNQTLHAANLYSTMMPATFPPLPVGPPPELIQPPPPPPRDHPPHLATYPSQFIAAANIGAGRMSEGSSCSDADGSLKRSKRIRRPNRLYCDDEYEGATTSAQLPVRLGNSTFNPGTPPEFTWDKDDLPSPQSRMKNIRKRKQERGSSTPIGDDTESPAPKKRRNPNTTKTPTGRPPSKKASKRTPSESKFPPIPTLKIRASQLAMASGGTTIAHHATSEIVMNTNHMTAFHEAAASTDDDDDDDEDDDQNSSSRSEASASSDNEGELLSQEHQTIQHMPQVPTLTQDCHNRWLALGGVNVGGYQNTTTPATTVAAATPIVVPQQQQQPQPEPLPPVPQAMAFNNNVPPALLPNPDLATLAYFRANNIRYPIRPPEGARQGRPDEAVYCYCRCPYDEVSEMIACDGLNCLIEWFHFECVGIMVAPKGKWFCAECRPRYNNV